MDFLHQLFSSDFMPHGHCYLWRPGLVWLQVISNLVVGLAYLSISTTLVLLVRRARDLPFHRVYFAFGLFIISCGVTHFMDIVVIWTPVYWIDGAIRSFTALASAATALWLFPLFPAVTKMVTVVAAERQQSRGDLESALAREKQARREAELAREELDRQRILLQAVLAQMPGGILVVDAAGKVIVTNEQGEQMRGDAAAHAVAASASERRGLHHADGRAYAADEYPAAGALRGEHFAGEVTYRQEPGGRSLVLEASAGPVRDGAGQIVAGVVVFADVTERRRLEKQFQFLADMIPHLVWTAQPDGTIDYANAKSLELRQEGNALSTMRQAWQGAVHPDDLARFEQLWRTGLSAAVAFEAEARLRTSPDGGFRRHLVRAVPFRDDSGELVRWFGTSTDIEDTRAADELMRQLFEMMPQLGSTGGADGQMDYFNRRWQQYTGIELDQLMGWGWQAAQDPEQLPLVLGRWKESLRAGVPFEMTLRLRRHDGVFRWFLTRVEPLRDGEGRIVRWIGINTDVDDQVRAEAEAADANRAKDEFLAMLGHELRNPLAPITTALHLMKLRGHGAEQERAMIERQVAHLTRLVDDLLDVSRITRGKINLVKAPVELAEVLAQAIELASPLIEQRAQRLTLEVPKSGLSIDGDAARLAQVFANLLTNAAKYSDVGATISVVATSGAASVVCRVIDQGRGIDAELLPRIFDAFAQAPQAIDRAQGGLGLGLAIVRSLVEMHGGTVRAISEGRNRGSELVVELPRSRAASESSPSPAPLTITRVAARGKRILLVDDNEDAAEMMAEMLRAAGHEVVVAYDGPKALEAVRRFTPDIAVLDIGLPVMSGYELATRLQALPGVGTARLIALTGYGQASDIERSRAAGFDQHLVKPVSPELILKILS